MSRHLLFLTTAFFITQLLHAQQDSSSKALDEVVVTANRFPQKQNSTGKVLTVIGRTEIERNSGRTLSELLIQQSGVTIVGANNALGTNQDIYMRGAATGNTLILIDGVPCYDPSNIASTFDINHIPLQTIERIEILKGAQSTVYGSDAVAGVINIITKKNNSKPVSVFGNLTAGSYDTYRFGAGLHGSSGKNSYQAQYEHLRSAGFSAAYDSTDKADWDNDGFQQNVASAAYQLRITDKLEWRINGKYSHYNYDLDASAFVDEKDYTGKNENIQAGTGFTWKYNKGSIVANYNFNNSKRNYIDDSLFVSGFTTFSTQYYLGKTQFAELYANHQLNDQHSLLAGIDYRRQQTDQDYYSLSGFGPYETHLSGDSAKASIFSGYASYFLKDFHHFFLEAGLRYNHHSRFGNNLTFSINPSYALENLKFFANVSSAFKAPSLYQLYDAASGNQSLKPEKSTTYEAGIQNFSFKRKWDTRIVFFHRNIRDGIEYSYADYKYFNNNQQKDYGIEVESRFRADNWNAGVNYTYLTGEVNTLKYAYDPATFSYVVTGDTIYNNLFRRPKHQFNVHGGVNVTKALYLALNARFTGKRYEPRFMESPLEMEAYKTFDLHAEYRILKQLVLFGDLNNMFNEKYADIRGYQARERNFNVGLRFAVDAGR
ncbi:TonB-dependent receptor plug domain-containing protein [Pollutibacter soli]|uniref:TonB-dependent receptor plug domain-containing protein n=1 Tax=Pollutibacter soli TaxID=3034157 RepID=UPI003013BDC6